MTTLRGEPAPKSPLDERCARWLRAALRDDLLSVVFQPVVNLLTGDVVVYEALGRLPLTLAGEPDYAPLGPLDWLDVAHDRGLLLELDRAWRRRAVEEVARGHAGSNTSFALNVDPRILDDPGFRSGYTRDIIERSQLSPSRFVLEITESGAHLGGGRLQEILSHYAAQGFRIAIDDLGAGYATLSSLLRLRPHVLKLDKDVVVGIAADPIRLNLVRALADFARRSGMQLIAEGIETEADLVGLLRAGVMFGQGFFIARPSSEPMPPATEIRACLRARAAEVERTRFHSISTRRIADIAREHPFVRGSLRGKEVERRFRAEPLTDGFPVVDEGGRVSGLIMRHRFLATIAGAFGYALYGDREIREIMDTQPLRVDASATIEFVSRLATARPETSRYDFILVERESRYLGVVTLYALLATTTELEIEHAAYASPLTGLPGNVVIEHEIRSALAAPSERGLPFFIYGDLDNFKAYNDVYGFPAGDEVIRLVARILDETFSPPAFENAFLGHVGGDDFIVVVHADEDHRVESACSRVAVRFDAEVLALYAPADVARGGIETTDRRGNTIAYPITGLSMAIVSSVDVTTHEVHEVGRVAADLKKRAKTEAMQRGGASGWVRERRQTGRAH
ncbi:MAG: bifunctional diguanylate cyclase/phosphodiesterase [Polyangiaceae bacterium]